MAINPLYTHELIGAFEQIVPPTQFLQYRYFGQEIVYRSHDILAEFRQRTRKLAPFVVERHNGIPVSRGTYDISTFSPPMIKLFRTLTADDLDMKGYGEALYPQFSREKRQEALLYDDLKELDAMIVRTEETMCASVMLNNGLTVKGYADDLTTYEEKSITFYTENANPANLSVSPYWNVSGCDILGTLETAVGMKIDAGQQPEDFVCAPDVVSLMRSNADLRSMLDNRRMEIGEIDPKLLELGVCLAGQLNIFGYPINIISYSGSYDNNGVNTRYIPSGYGILASRDAGVRTYGQIAQIEQENGAIEFFANKRVPMFISDRRSSTRQIFLSSRPLPIPKDKNSFIVMKVKA